MLRWVDAAPGVRLWAERIDGPGPEPVLLVADADASALTWPDALITRFGAHRPVIRYDHRDTGRSTRSVEEPRYGLPDLAADALAVLDAYGDRRAHAVGHGLGGLVLQLLLLDHPDRLASAAFLGTGPLPGPGLPPLPGPLLAVRRLLAEQDDPRDDAGELAWRVAHRRLLNGQVLPFDEPAARALELRAAEHAGTWEAGGAHRLLAEPPARGDALGAVAVPTLVVDAPEDPVFPPPNATVLAELLGAATTVLPGLGHVVPDAAAPALADALLAFHADQPAAR